MIALRNTNKRIRLKDQQNHIFITTLLCLINCRGAGGGGGGIKREWDSFLSFLKWGVIIKWSRGNLDPCTKMGVANKRGGGVEKTFRVLSTIHYSGLSLSRIPSISNFSLSRIETSVPWTFMLPSSYFSLFISNTLYLEHLPISNKYFGPLPVFLSLSRTFSLLHNKIKQKRSIFEIRMLQLIRIGMKNIQRSQNRIWFRQL